MGKSKRKLKNRLRGRNHHHLTPRSRGGKSNPGNLLLINIEKHKCWHCLFKLRTLKEVIS